MPVVGLVPGGPLMAVSLEWPAARVPERLALFRRHPDSFSPRFEARGNVYLAYAKQMRRFLRAHPVAPERLGEWQRIGFARQYGRAAGLELEQGRRAKAAAYRLRARALEGSLAVLGTCAGMIAVAKAGDDQVRRTGTELLGLVDMEVDRNAFGRQRESFEADLPVEGFERPLHAVFIRAPAARRVYGGARALATYAGRVVFVGQGAVLATAFHPELTDDTRVHAMLLDRA